MKKQKIKVEKKTFKTKNGLTGKKEEDYIYYFTVGKYCYDGDTLK